MITAFVSALLGIFGGVVPDIVKEIRESRDHRRRMEKMRLQLDLQIKLLEVQAQVKFADADAQLMIDQIRKAERGEAGWPVQARSLGADDTAEDALASVAADHERLAPDPDDGARAMMRPRGASDAGWIDGLNALIRPISVALMMILFFVIATLYSYAVIERTVAIGPGGFEVAATVIWGSLVGEVIQAVLGFLFGWAVTARRLDAGGMRAPAAVSRRRLAPWQGQDR
jgi:hypothetical protein